MIHDSCHVTIIIININIIKLGRSPPSSGRTSLHHKAAGLVHILHLEAGPEIGSYCNQVIATISDQGKARTVDCVAVADCD